jgi:hypothetical protein
MDSNARPDGGQDPAAAVLIRSARRLRAAGVPLGSAEVITYCQAAGRAALDYLDDL